MVGSCCCFREKDCNKLRNSFLSAGDTLRGGPPFRFQVIWISKYATTPWKEAFAASLGFTADRLTRLTATSVQAHLFVNRHHYDIRQIELFKSNQKARSKAIPLAEMQQYTRVEERRASFTKNGGAITHVYHFPNYPWYDAQRELRSLTTSSNPRSQTTSCKADRIKKLQGMDFEEIDDVIEDEKSKRRRAELEIEKLKKRAKVSKETIDRLKQESINIKRETGDLRQTNAGLEDRVQKLETKIKNAMMTLASPSKTSKP